MYIEGDYSVKRVFDVSIKRCHTGSSTGQRFSFFATACSYCAAFIFAILAYDLNVIDYH